MTLPAPLPPQLLPVHQDNSVAARVQRRRDFRRLFQPVNAERYVPQAYDNQFVPADLVGPFDQLLDDPENAERAGASHADPS